MDEPLGEGLRGFRVSGVTGMTSLTLSLSLSVSVSCQCTKAAVCTAIRRRARQAGTGFSTAAIFRKYGLWSVLECSMESQKHRADMSECLQHCRAL